MSTKGWTASKAMNHVSDGPGVPLNLVSRLPGDAGFGKSAPSVVPVEGGVVVSRRGVISLHSHDLRTEVWRLERPGWCEIGPRTTTTIFTGVFGGHFCEIDIRNGAVRRQSPESDEATALRGASPDLLLVSRPDRGVWAVDWDGKVAWERAQRGQLVVAVRADAFYVTENLDRRLSCVEAATGRVRWSREFGVRVVSWGSGVVALEQALLVRTHDGRMLRLELVDGSIVDEYRLPASGLVQVTEDEVFVKWPFECATYDHSLRERERLTYRSEIEPAYAGQRPTVNAFCVTEKALFWTTMGSTLMGVSRRCMGPARTAWSFPVPGAIMPIAEPPVAREPYLYLRRKSEDSELLCFRADNPSAPA